MRLLPVLLIYFRAATLEMSVYVETLSWAVEIDYGNEVSLRFFLNI